MQTIVGSTIVVNIETMPFHGQNLFGPVKKADQNSGTNVGEVLRAIRSERGYSQESLAFETGYHRTYIGLLERGRRAHPCERL